MPNNTNAKKEENSQSSKNIQIPPVRKQTAGAVAGAAAGSVTGPIGAVVGELWALLSAKPTKKGQPIVPAAKRTVRNVVSEKVKGHLETATQSRSKHEIQC